MGCSARQMFNRTTTFSVPVLLICEQPWKPEIQGQFSAFERQGGLSVIMALSAGNTITIRSAVTAKHRWSVQVSAACIVRLHGVITRKIYK